VDRVKAHAAITLAGYKQPKYVVPTLVKLRSSVGVVLAPVAPVSWSCVLAEAGIRCQWWLTPDVRTLNDAF
jgi:hypothetical protein